MSRFSFPKSSKELCSLDSTSSSLQPSKWSINHPDGFFTIYCHLLGSSSWLCLYSQRSFGGVENLPFFVFCWHPNPKGLKGSKHFSHHFQQEELQRRIAALQKAGRAMETTSKNQLCSIGLWSSCTDMIEWHAEMLLLMHFSYLAWLASTRFTWTCIMLRSTTRRRD